MWPDRSQDAGCLELIAGSEESFEPSIVGEFIVIDECDVVALCMGERLVASERDILSRFVAVNGFDRGALGKRIDHLFG